MRGNGYGQLTVGIQKSLWTKAANLCLNVSDVLRTAVYGGTINYANVDLRFQSRVARLTFTYNFGNKRKGYR